MIITKETLILILVVGVVSGTVMSLLATNLFNIISSTDTENLEIMVDAVVSDSAGNYVLSFTVNNHSTTDIRYRAQLLTTIPGDISFGDFSDDSTLELSGGEYSQPVLWLDGTTNSITLAPGQSMSVNHHIGKLDLDDDQTLYLVIFYLPGDIVGNIIPVDIKAG